MRLHDSWAIRILGKRNKTFARGAESRASFSRCAALGTPDLISPPPLLDPFSGLVITCAMTYGGEFPRGPTCEGGLCVPCSPTLFRYIPILGPASLVGFGTTALLHFLDRYIQPTAVYRFNLAFQSRSHRLLLLGSSICLHDINDDKRRQHQSRLPQVLERLRRSHPG
jgi:hypothetical protein